MNTYLKNLIDTSNPKIHNLSKKEINLYKAELGILASIISEEFFDIKKLSKDRFGTDGLFYEIPYFDSDELWCSGNQRTMVVVYEVKNKSSYCPLRIDFKLVDKNNIYLYVYKQSGDRPDKIILIAKENGEWITEVTNYETIKLSELLYI